MRVVPGTSAVDNSLATCRDVAVPAMPGAPLAALPRCPRFRFLDSWRGIACLFVVIFHSTIVYAKGTKGDTAWADAVLRITYLLHIGVPMFFVISGYCISATADSTRIRGLPIRNYFFRRFRRIFPPYWFAILFQIALMLLVDCWLAPGVLSRGIRPIARPWEFSASQWFGNTTLTESWRYLVAGGQRDYILGQSWTLCYEEQFYAVTGLLLLLGGSRFFLAAGICTVLTLLMKHGFPRLGWGIDGMFADGGWLMFAAGVLVYYLVNYATARGWWAGVAGFACFAAYAFRTRDSYLGVAIGFALLLLFTHRWDGLLSRQPSLQPVRLLGTICYSLYLVHAPIVRGISQHLYSRGVTSASGTLLVTLPICIGAACLAGWLFYMAVERRFLNAPRV